MPGVEEEEEAREKQRTPTAQNIMPSLQLVMSLTSHPRMFG
jgi:hypothetical protein